MKNLSPTERFSSRVDAYIKYRPSYPYQIIEYLKAEAGLTPQSIIADIGSGTGFLSKLFLENGNTVFGIEPNNPMREAAEKYLSNYKNFISQSGRAEQTFLEDSSIDLIAAGQAFHWFEPEETKKEFVRIGRDGAIIVLVWNRRDLENDALQKEYEEILTGMLPEYSEVDHKRIDEGIIKNFISPFPLTVKSFENYQLLDFESFIGRLLSSSYCPDESTGLYAELKNRMTILFNKYTVDNKLKFNYKTMVYLGRIK